MSKQTKQAGILALAILAVIVAPVRAGVTLVKSRAAMDGNDLINWAQLGKPIATVTSPGDVTSNVGLRAIVSNLRGSTLGEERQGDQGVEFMPTPFTEVITAHDFDGNLLGTFTVAGEESTDANNSAVFVGIKASITGNQHGGVLYDDFHGPGSRCDRH